MRSTIFFLNLLSVVILPQLVACSDGTSSLDFSDSMGNPIENQLISPNRDLTGSVVSLYKNQLWRMDFKSGHLSKFKRAPFNEDPTFSNLAFFEVTAAGDGTNGYLLGVDSCYMDGVAVLGCLQYLDIEGFATKTLYFDYNISSDSGTLPFSKTGSYFAARSTLPGNKFLSLYSRDGRLLADEKINITGFEDLKSDWGADDTLYYSRPDDRTPKIYYWNLGDDATSGHYEFEYEGRIGSIDTHPSEPKIAFELINSESSIYIADLETGKSYRLLQSDNSNGGQFFTSPEWSPDGMWILAQHHNPEADTTRLAPYNLIAIPSDAIDIVYDLSDTSSTAVPFRITDDSATVLGSGSQAAWFRGGSFFWIAN